MLITPFFYVEKVHSSLCIVTYLCTSSCTSSLKSSSGQDESVVDFDIEEYESTKRYHSKYHCLKDVHIVLYIDFTISENDKKESYLCFYYVLPILYEITNCSYDCFKRQTFIFKVFLYLL